MSIFEEKKLAPYASAQTGASNVIEFECDWFVGCTIMLSRSPLPPCEVICWDVRVKSIHKDDGMLMGICDDMSFSFERGVFWGGFGGKIFRYGVMDNELNLQRFRIGDVCHFKHDPHASKLYMKVDRFPQQTFAVCLPRTVKRRIMLLSVVPSALESWVVRNW